MDIKNILIVSPMYKELKDIIEAEGLDHYHIRYVSETEVSESDFAWAEALVSFHLKAEYDYSHLKWVHSLGAGVDRFIYKKKWNEGVLLTRTICSFGQRIAEFCLSYILRDLQAHERFNQQQKQKMWKQLTPKIANQQSVMIYGTGEIGQETAKVLTMLGMDVYGVSLSGSKKESFKEVYTVDCHLSKLPEMNFVINTLPLTEQTDGFFDQFFFDQLSNAGFINVGRGASLNETALISAINNHNVKFAVLDVFQTEPLPKESPLWNHPQIYITPHISAVTTPSEGALCFLETLKRIEEGKPLTNKVDVRKGY